MVAQRNQGARLPLWQTMAWGMLYGSALAFFFAILSGKTPGFEATLAYVGSLIYLAVRANYIGVMVPVVALFVSAAFEGFRFHALTWAGIALSVVGNVLVLGKS